MTNLTGQERGAYVQNMFARISTRYDLMNRIMTGGFDRAWRRKVIEHASLQPGQRMLDLGAGTGDLAFEAQARHPDVDVLAADFTIEMMRAGQGRPGAAALRWLCADATQLPFAPASFDALVSGFLVRNVGDLDMSLREQNRTLKPAGRLVILDTTRPPDNLLAPFVKIYFRYIIPALGRLIAGESDAYVYLPSSSEAFLSAEELSARLARAGFMNIHFKRFMFGTIAVHWAVKEG